MNRIVGIIESPTAPAMTNVVWVNKGVMNYFRNGTWVPLGDKKEIEEIKDTLDALAVVFAEGKPGQVFKKTSDGVEWGNDDNTAYTFTNGTNGSFTVTPVGGKAQTVTIGTIPTNVSQLTNDSKYVTETTLTSKGYTTNTGTITGITMNGASKGTSGVVNLGTVITEHQSLTGKQDVISDLATIRSNAAKGATALQSVPAATTSILGGVKQVISPTALEEGSELTDVVTQLNAVITALKSSGIFQ